MITIFDLDYTLLDTARFKEALARLLNMDLTEFDKSCNKNFENKGINYNLESHLGILEVKNKKKILKDFENMDISIYLNNGALDVILNERKISEKLVLLTLGNNSWQKEKVDKLGEIKKIFDEIVYENKEKYSSLFLKNIPKDVKVKIINDNFEETARMVNKITESRNGDKSAIEVIIVKGPYSVNAEGLSKKIKERGWRYCENIGELRSEN